MIRNNQNSSIKSVQSKRIVSHHIEEIEASPEQIFPLLCPIQEYKWIDEWQCEMVYSDSGEVESNCVFREDKTGPILFDSAISTCWVVSLYDPATHRIQFVLLMDTIAVAKIDVEVQSLGDALSSVVWTFTITSLSEKANGMVTAATEQKAKMILTVLGQSLKHYCDTGEVFRLNGVNLMRVGLSASLAGILKSHQSLLRPIGNKEE